MNLKKYKNIIIGLFLFPIFGLPFVTAAQGAVGKSYTRYCPDPTQIFTGIALDDAERPKLELIVDPVFNAKMKAERNTPDLPVTPIYDLVVTAVPTINEYCLPQYDENGRLIQKVDPPKIISSFTVYIALGKETLLGGFLVNSGRRTDSGQLIYEWDLKGWPRGIFVSEKLERVIKAVQENDPTLRIGVTAFKLDGAVTGTWEKGITFALCAPLSGGSPHKVINMRGKSAGMNVPTLVDGAEAYRKEGFEVIEPFKNYSLKGPQGSYFAHFADLSLHDDTNWTMFLRFFVAANQRPRELSPCGSDGSQYYFHTGRINTNKINAYAPYGGGIAFLGATGGGHVSTEIAMHETGHSFGGLEDEYHSGFDVTLFSHNCAVASNRTDADIASVMGVPMSKITPATHVSIEAVQKKIGGGRNKDVTIFKKAYWDPYGDTITGCHVNSQVRPSMKSLMNSGEFRSEQFNVVSCVYIRYKTTGETDLDTNLRECMKLGGLEKPSPRPLVTIGISLRLPSFLNSWLGNGLFAAVAASPVTADISTQGNSLSRFISVETFSTDGKEIQSEMFEQVGEGENATWRMVVPSEDEISSGNQSEQRLPMPLDLSCTNPRKVITVGGIGSPSTHPQFAWVRGITSVAAEIAIKDLSIVQSTAKLQDAINKQLAAGEKVLVVAHSLGAIIAFNLKDEFKDKPVEFIYIDPPYDSVGPVRGAAGFFSSTARAINLAYKNGIKDDSNTIDWTKGKSAAPFHDPWESKNSDNPVNQENLKKLKATIIEKLCLSDVEASEGDGAPVGSDSVEIHTQDYDGQVSKQPDLPKAGNTLVRKSLPAKTSSLSSGCSGEIRGKNEVEWGVRAFGGDGTYTYKWSGTDGLSGEGRTIRKQYEVGGFKRAAVAISSGGERMRCDARVELPDDGPVPSVSELESRDVFIIEVDRKDASFYDRSKIFYEKYKRDDWDFLALYTDYSDIANAGFGMLHHLAKNEVKGIGLPPFDWTSAFGSRGRLLGAATLLNPNMYDDAPYNALLEETFAHSFGVFVRDEKLPVGDGAHWSQCMSFPKASGAEYDYWKANTWHDNGDGTWTDEAPHLFASQHLDPFMLYLAGFLPAEQVPDATLLTPQSGDASECSLKETIRATARTISVQDIIALYGPRVPSYAESQKHFKTAFVLAVLKGHTPPDATLKRLAVWAEQWPKVLGEATTFSPSEITADSDKALSVSALRVLSPKSDEIWNAGALMNVLWKSDRLSPEAAVRISLWRGRGTTTVSTNRLIQGITTPNDGSEKWVIPPLLHSGLYFIEIACADKNASACVSGASGAFQVVRPETSAVMSVDLKVDDSDRPPAAKRGKKLLLSWKVSNVASCYPNWPIPGMSVVRADGESEAVFDSDRPKIYELTCYNAENNQTVSDSVAVRALR